MRTVFLSVWCTLVTVALAAVVVGGNHAINEAACQCGASCGGSITVDRWQVIGAVPQSPYVQRVILLDSAGGSIRAVDVRLREPRTEEVTPSIPQIETQSEA